MTSQRGDFNDSSELLKWSSNSFKWRLSRCHICHPFSPQSSPDPSWSSMQLGGASNNYQAETLKLPSTGDPWWPTCWVALGNAPGPCYQLQMLAIFGQKPPKCHAKPLRPISGFWLSGAGSPPRFASKKRFGVEKSMGFAIENWDSTMVTINCNSGGWWSYMITVKLQTCWNWLCFSGQSWQAKFAIFDMVTVYSTCFRHGGFSIVTFA